MIDHVFIASSLLPPVPRGLEAPPHAAQSGQGGLSPPAGDHLQAAADEIEARLDPTVVREHIDKIHKKGKSA